MYEQPDKDCQKSGARLANYYRYMAAIAKGTGEASHTPAEISLEMACSCNFNCRFCEIRTLEKRPHGPSSLLAPELVAKVAPAIPGALSVSLHGFGEPLLNPETVPLAEKIARSGGLTDFVTNGSLLRAETAHALVAAGVWRITVSLSTPDPGDYARLYEGGDLGRLVKNLETLRDAKLAAGRSRPEITFNAIALASTLHQLPDLARLAATLQVSVLELKPLMVYEKLPTGELVTYDESAHRPIIDAAARYCAGNGIYFNADAFIEATGRAAAAPQTSKLPCPLAFRGVSIRADGSVKPCCFADWSLSLGNLNDQSLAEAWNGDEYVAFRRQHLAGVVPPICRNCVTRGLAPVSDAAGDWLRILGHDPFDPTRLFALTARHRAENGAAPGEKAVAALRLAKEVLQELVNGAARLESLAPVVAEFAAAAGDFARTAAPLLNVSGEAGSSGKDTLLAAIAELDRQLERTRNGVIAALEAAGSR